MKVHINGKAGTVEPDQTIDEVRMQYCPEADITIRNCIISPPGHTRVAEGDALYFIRKGVAPDADNLEKLLYARQPDALTGRLKSARVGIVGAGGLGSVVAENLARAGVGKLVIADFDLIEPSNLNRQRFTVAQLGTPKVDALAENIRSFNPFTAVDAVHERITAENCRQIFSGCGIIAECLDSASEKAAIVTALRNHHPESFIVAASGLAGLGNGSSIKTVKATARLYIVGDMTSDADQGLGLFASRVGIAASMQAHVIIQLLTGVEPC